MEFHFISDHTHCLPSVLSLGTTEESGFFFFFFLISPLQIVTHIDKTPPEPFLLPSKQAQISALFQRLQPHYHFAVSLLDTLHYAHGSLAVESPAVGTTLAHLTNAEQRRRIISLNLLSPFLLKQPSKLLIFEAMTYTSGLRSTWCPPGSPGTSLQWCFQPIGPQPKLLPVVIFPQVQVCISLWWISWSSCWSWSFWVSAQEHRQLSCCLQACWFTLLQQPDH